MAKWVAKTEAGHASNLRLRVREPSLCPLRIVLGKGFQHRQLRKHAGLCSKGRESAGLQRMSGTVADELRALVDEPATTATTNRLLELAIVVERMERQIDTIVSEARDDAQSLDGLIRRCNA